MLPEFDLLTPQSLSEALRMLEEHGSDVLPIAGGTNVVVGLRETRSAPKFLMDLSSLEELSGIRRENGHIVIGGGTTITQLLEDPLIAQHGRSLRQAGVTLGNPLIRNRATVAGNLVDASPAADTAPPLLVLDAKVELVSQAGTRQVALDEFITGVNETLRRPDELVVALRWPVPDAQSADAFYKIGLRRATACSVISAAVMLMQDGSGRCRQARIALGAVAPRPIRAYEAEEALCGQPLDSDSIEQAGRLASQASSPIDDVRASAEYRQRMADVLVRRLLNQIVNENTE